jgi:tetratricopeptide (TPR) repeat protein
VLWSNQFNGAASLFDLEDSVALAVANAMRVTLTENQRVALRAAPVAPEVHRVLVRARGYVERRDDESLHAGVDLLRTALAMDSMYAPTWATLARAHVLLGVYDYTLGDSDFRAASTAVERALALDSTLAGAHLTRAMLHVFYDHDAHAAAAEFTRTLALDSTDASTYLFRSWYYLWMNQLDSAVATIRTARRLDPNSPIIRTREGTVLCALVARGGEGARGRTRRGLGEHVRALSAECGARRRWALPRRPADGHPTSADAGEV